MWSTGGCHIFGEWWFAIQWKKVKDIKLFMWNARKLEAKVLRFLKKNKDNRG